jgi:hypothetical protein
MQRSHTLRVNDANYMRATKSSSLHRASKDNKQGIRQASLSEWKIPGKNKRFDSIGLVSKKK